MRNVVLVTVDSLRDDHVGCYGYDQDTTPVVDSIAEEGLFFDAYANATWTRASFPSILTSTYPLEYGGYEYLADDRTTVGEAVTETHATAAFHSNLWLSRDYNYDSGFDCFYDSKSNPSPLARLRTFLKLNLDHDGLAYRLLQWFYDRTEATAGVDVGQTYQNAETVTDRALEWIERAATPFVCWIHYMDVHHPYVPHEQAAEDLGLGLDITEREAIQLRRKMVETPEEITEVDRRVLIDLYDNEIRYTDTQIGRLREAVNDRDDSTATSFIVTSDHGEEFGEHGGYSHNPGMYDEVLHVPFVVDPGSDDVFPTGKQPEQVELLDVAPTVCDLAGVEPPGSFRGRSVLDAAGSGVHARVFSETIPQTEPKLALRTPEWKYIWDIESNTAELYDLERDPSETTNVIEDDPLVADHMREELEAHLADLRVKSTELPDVSMDPKTEQRLQDLGYLD